MTFKTSIVCGQVAETFAALCETEQFVEAAALLETVALTNTKTGKHGSVVQAKKWQSLPKGWDDKSVKKFWNSLTGDRKHKFTACKKKMEQAGTVSNPEAFCAALKDYIEKKTTWRKGRRH